MRLGALLGPITEPQDSKFIANQAREYADAGYQSLWSAQTVARGFMLTDPLQALTAAAAVTEGLELGTAVVQQPLYHPMELAHRVFSLQQMCSAGLLLGIGAGSTKEDFMAYDRPFEQRFADFDAGVAALREIFSTGGVGGGEVKLSPWPAVATGPQLFFGTWGAGVQRAAADFDGWIASGHYRTVEQVCETLQVYREAGGGRAIVSTLQVGGDTDLGEFGDKLRRFAEAGFDDAVIMRGPGAPSADAIRQLLD